MNILGTVVTVTVDRPLGSRHPRFTDMIYPVNYGFVKGIMAADGEEQDAYILGVEEAVSEFEGRVIAVIHRKNDAEDKWVVAPDGIKLNQAEILGAVLFQEQYFEVELDCLYQKSCGMIVYRKNSGILEFLLLFQHRSKTWSFPKGHAEPYETETQTAIREVREETGLCLELMDGFREEIIYSTLSGSVKTVVLFLGQAVGDVIMKQYEIAEFVWADKKEANRYLGREGYAEILNRAEKRIFDLYIHD